MRVYILKREVVKSWPISKSESNQSPWDSMAYPSQSMTRWNDVVRGESGESQTKAVSASCQVLRAKSLLGVPVKYTVLYECHRHKL